MANRAAWMIYGANGYTGHLVAAEAKRQGLNPVLAGRRAGPIEKLATELGLRRQAANNHDTDRIRSCGRSDWNGDGRKSRSSGRQRHRLVGSIG